MVLSNKRLKQRLRAELAETLAASEAQNHQTHRSLKSLLDSATQKPRVSKREKRREKILPLLQGGDDDADTKKETDEGGSKAVDEHKRKRKKRKRDGDGGEGSEDGASENVEANKANKSTNKKKKKKKKRKAKKEKKAENVEVSKGLDSANGGSGEQSVAEIIKTSDSQEKADASTKVYVGGIPYYSTEDDIRSFFEGCGTITQVDCMKFPESGKFRGIAIICFKTEAATKRALALDGADMGGLFLKIQPYKSTRESKVSDFSPVIVEGYNRVYVGNLSWDITEDELRKLFTDCNMSSIRFGEDKETGKFRGYAHVDFADSLSLTIGLKLDQKIVCGRPVRIRCAVPKKVAETNSKSVPTSKKTDDGEVGSVSGKIRRRTCYECGERGHLSSSCPKKLDADPMNSSAS